jgi:hypothetical protein
MKIRVKTILFAPRNKRWVTTPNPVLGSGEFEIELNRDILADLLEHSIGYRGVNYKFFPHDYDRATNTLSVAGDLPSESTCEKISELEKLDWTFNKAACALYDIT